MKDKLVLRFCQWAIVEGCSYLFLLFVAMPLEHHGFPQFKHWPGWVHGILFVMYMVYLIKLAKRDDWEMKQIVSSFLFAFVPFGTFYVEWKTKKDYRVGGTLSAESE